MRFWARSAACSWKSRASAALRCCSRGGFSWLRKEAEATSSRRLAGGGLGNPVSPAAPASPHPAQQVSRQRLVRACSSTVGWSRSRIWRRQGRVRETLGGRLRRRALPFWTSGAGQRCPGGWLLLPSAEGALKWGCAHILRSWSAQPALHTQTWEAPGLPSSVLFCPIGPHLWGCYPFSEPLFLSLRPSTPPKQLGALSLNHLPDTRLRHQP